MMGDHVPSGWMIGVLLELEDEPEPLRHFYAVAQPDQSRAEWAAADRALLAGIIASSPYGGMEPVEAVRALSGPALRLLGLKPGQLKAFGRKLPRGFLESPSG